MSMHDSIKNAQLSMTRAKPVQTNAPYDSGPITSRYSVETALMYEKIAPYAGNVFEAKIQGLNYEDFYAWTDVLLRAAPVVDASTGDNMNPDWQRIMIIDRHIDFIPAGAYVQFNGNTWIVYNPDNVTSDIGTGVVQRCNATYNSLDWYGNVVKTPMVVAKGKVLASSPYYMEYSAIMDGYGHILMQYNEDTKDVHDNTRFILGNSAYAFYGVVNYAQEFTGDENSVHIIKSDFRVNEVLENDDLENKVADGKSFRLELDVPDSITVRNGEAMPLSAIVRRNGETVTDSESHPINVLYIPDMFDICSYYSGQVHGNSVGNATIRCTLAQNPSISSNVSVTVEEPPMNDYVGFTSTVPDSAPVFSTFPVSAAFFHEGEATNDPVKFYLSGIKPNYATIVDNGDNTADISVWVPDGVMTIHAMCNGYEATESVALEGF